jgi:hypothetical protein
VKRKKKCFVQVIAESWKEKKKNVMKLVAVAMKIVKCWPPELDKRKNARKQIKARKAHRQSERNVNSFEVFFRAKYRKNFNEVLLDFFVFSRNESETETENK